MAIQEVLSELGLNKKEAEVYLALLRLGEAGASRLASITNINRVTVYSTLETLKSKGFIHAVVKQNTTKFIPKEPKEILTLLKQKEDKFSSIIGDLENMSGEIKTKSAVTLFEGPKREVELMDQVFSYIGGEVLSYGNMNVPEKVGEHETINLRKRRLERGVKIRSVTNKKEHVSVDDKKFKQLTKMRVLKALDKVTTWTYIFGNKVAITPLKKEVVGILVENEEFAETQRMIFEMLWKKGKGTN